MQKKCILTLGAVLFLISPVALNAAPSQGWSVSAGYSGGNVAISSMRISMTLPEKVGTRINTSLGFVFVCMPSGLDNLLNDDEPEFRLEYGSGIKMDAGIMRFARFQLHFGIETLLARIKSEESYPTTDEIALEAKDYSSSWYFVAEPVLSIEFELTKSISFLTSIGTQYAIQLNEEPYNYINGALIVQFEVRWFPL